MILLLLLKGLYWLHFFFQNTLIWYKVILLIFLIFRLYSLLWLILIFIVVIDLSWIRSLLFIGVPFKVFSKTQKLFHGVSRFMYPVQFGLPNRWFGSNNIPHILRCRCSNMLMWSHFSKVINFYSKLLKIVNSKNNWFLK